MRCSWKWVVLWSLWAARLVRQPTAPLRVTGGLLRGAVAPDGSHAYYLAVPYATIPARFQDPGPEPKWEGIFEAVDEHIRCPQRFTETLVLGQENCLILNVYTPMNTSPDALLPVMVFIHGGGFFQGSSTRFMYGPEYIVSKGVILVAFNYRLNIQGYICLGIKEAPGNAGMKDQVAALRWVKNNIRAFGGDPEHVTLFGESAGGASVSYHILSPMSKGLFHKAILQSGSSLAPWAYQFDSAVKASMLARSMEFLAEDPYTLYDFYMNQTDDDLIVTRVPRETGNLYLSEVMYVPCTEKKLTGVESFLDELPFDILRKGNYNKVPMIIGTNNEEGYLFAAMENETVLPMIDFERSLPNNLEFPTVREQKETAEIARMLYMRGDKISKESIMKLSKLHGEPYFNCPLLEETELYLQTNDQPIYNYLFSYSGWRNFAKFSSENPFASAPGATHADELFYMFGQSIVPSLFESEMIEKITTLWTNFAKFSDPTPEVSDLLPMKWLPTNQSSPRALVIDSQFTTTPLWHTDSLRYWRQVYSKYRRKRN